MTLHSILPVEDIRKHFTRQVALTQLGMSEYDRIVAVAPGSVLNVGLACWNRIVHGRKHKVNPRAMAEYVDNQDPALVSAIGDLIGEPVIKDISYSDCTLDDPDLDGDITLVEGRTVARLLIAHMYPNSVHIADVYFCDPYRPLQAADRKYTYRSHKGLGLLGNVLVGVERFAAQSGVHYVTLTAAADDLVPLFSKYGYQFEKNKIGRMARAMEKRVSQQS